ncbi:MAG: serine/threonine-protein kinase [Myxococcota bacterium]
MSIPPLSLEGMVLSDRYRVLKKLGEGGMGSVYLAEHTTIKKRLALKVLSSEYSHKQDLVDRFLQEARAASMIDQQNVVEITDFGSVPNGSVFFVMEFLNGEDLSRTIKTQGALPWARVKPIMLQICAALTAAHEAGIIHRDMKPENCYRIKRGSNEDFIKVLDFGIAKVTTDDGEGGRGLTRTGMIFGTPEYMSPEQAKGEKVDFRVDVYAVGVILYELLTGQVPFTADTFMGILTKHMFEAPPAPSQVAPEADIPQKVEAIILKALQKDREYRFQSMRDLAEAIEDVASDSAAVSVVAERVVAPSGGQTHFSTSSPAVPIGGPGTVPPEESKSRGGIIGIAAFTLVLGGAAAFYFTQDDGKPNETEAKPAAVAAPADPKPPPTEPAADDAGKAPVEPAADDGKVPPPTEPEPTVAAITISTPGVEAQVIDSRDDTVLGATNEAFELPLGTDSLDLVVRAEGYEDLVVPAVPDGDKTVVAALTKASTKGGRKGGRRGGRKGGRNGSKGGTKAGDTKTTDTKAADKPKNTGSGNSGSSGSGGSPDLKDPFRNR